MSNASGIKMKELIGKMYGATTTVKIADVELPIKPLTFGEMMEATLLLPMEDVVFTDAELEAYKKDGKLPEIEHTAEYNVASMKHMKFVIEKTLLKIPGFEYDPKLLDGDYSVFKMFLPVYNAAMQLSDIPTELKKNQPLIPFLDPLTCSQSTTIVQ